MASQGGDMGAGTAPMSLKRELNRSMTLPVGEAEELLLDEAAAVCDAELQGTRVALRNRAQDASKKLLQLMHETRDNLRFWEEQLQSPASLQRVILLQTGARMFFRYATRWAMRALGYAPQPRYDSTTMVQRRIQALRRVNDGLAVALGEIHLQADVLTRMHLSSKNAMDTLGACSTNMSMAVAALEGIQITGPELPDEGEEEEDAGGSIGSERSMLLLTPIARRQDSTSGMRRSTSNQDVLQPQPFDMKQVWSELQALHASSVRAHRNIRGLLHRHRAPTREEQTWVRRWCRGTALGAAALYIAAHSPLNGSHDLSQWATQLMQSVHSFFSDHCWEPMQQISKELRRTFAAQEDVDVLALEESKNILQRMLQEFQQRQKHLPSAPAGETNSSRAMEQVLKKFEAEARSPIQNLVTGDLSNLMMIQMQAMKVDMESALLQMDRILQANQINFAAMAAMPFFASLWGLATLARRLMLPNTAAAKARASSQRQYARILLVEAERSILLGVEAGGRTQQPLELGQQIFCLNALYVEAVEQARHMSGMEWYNLRADILELAAPRTPVERKIRILSRMRHSYSVFRDG